MSQTRIAVYGPERRIGVWHEDLLVDLGHADERLPADLPGLIELGERGLDLADSAVKAALKSGAPGDGTVFDIATVTLHPPAVHRPRIACAGGNYAAHTLGSAKRKGFEATNALAGLVDSGGMPTANEVVAKTRERGEPRGFWKDSATLMGSDNDIFYPDRCERLDYEGEVAVVLGREALDVPPGRGHDFVWGVTLINDWSIRKKSGKSTSSFNLSKNWYGSASIGPCIVVGDIDPGDLEVETRVNGELRQQYNSGDMIFSHAEYIEYLSRDFALLPGDMISGGSGPGTATDAEKDLATGDEISDERRESLFLQAGDIVEVSSVEIGTLRNCIVAKGRVAR